MEGRVGGIEGSILHLGGSEGFHISEVSESMIFWEDMEGGGVLVEVIKFEGREREVVGSIESW